MLPANSPSGNEIQQWNSHGRDLLKLLNVLFLKIPQFMIDGSEKFFKYWILNLRLSILLRGAVSALSLTHVYSN